MITVVLLCWKRFGNFEKILKFWLSQKKVGQIIVWDNSGSFKTKLPILVISSNQNLGSVIKLVAAKIAKFDHIIFCDDDLQPRGEIIKDLFATFTDNKVMGIMGKQFTGKTYVGSPRVDGRSIKKPVEVDYIPYNLCLVHRKHCLVDVRTHRFIQNSDKLYLDDWWWQHELKKKNPEISFWVVPTKGFSIYPEDGYKYAINQNPKALQIREKYFKKWVKKEK